MKNFQYKMNNLISRGPRTLMLMLVALTLVVVLLLGTAAFFLRDDGVSYGVTLWYTFNHIVDPGYLFGNGDESVGFLALMTLATFWGILVYSLVISFVSTALLKKLEELRLGRNAIVETGHTLILDYQRAVLTMIEELIEARSDQKKMVIVILANQDPADIYHVVDPLIKHHKHIKVIVRKGEPTFARDLAMVSIDTCSSVLISSQSDLMTIKILLAVKQTKFMDVPDNFGVAMIEDEKNLAIARDLAGDQFYLLFLKELKTKIMARTCLHPGLASIYKNIFSFVGEEVYFLKHPSFEGKNFKDLVHHLEGGYAMGIRHHQKAYLNPSLTKKLLPEDELIVLATSSRDVRFVDNASSTSIQSNSAPYQHSSRHVLLIGFNPDVIPTILEMEKYVAPSSTLTILVKSESDHQTLLSAYSTSKFAKVEIRVGETYSRHVLEQLPLATVDTIGLFANHEPSQGDADAETLLSLLHLHQLMLPLPQKPSLVVEIHDASHVDTLSQIGLDDFLVSDVLFSKMMTQISENPEIYPVLEELVSEQGQEFYLRRANAYLAADKAYSFRHFIEAGLQKKQLVVGYKKHGEAIVLNPSKDTVVTFGPQDRLIILAEF